MLPFLRTSNVFSRLSFTCCGGAGRGTMGLATLGAEPFRGVHGAVVLSEAIKKAAGPSWEYWDLEVFYVMG